MWPRLWSEKKQTRDRSTSTSLDGQEEGFDPILLGYEVINPPNTPASVPQPASPTFTAEQQTDTSDGPPLPTSTTTAERSLEEPEDGLVDEDPKHLKPGPTVSAEPKKDDVQEGGVAYDIPPSEYSAPSTTDEFDELFSMPPPPLLGVGGIGSLPM